MKKLYNDIFFLHNHVVPVDTTMEYRFSTTNQEHKLIDLEQKHSKKPMNLKLFGVPL